MWLSNTLKTSIAFTAIVFCAYADEFKIEARNFEIVGHHPNLALYFGRCEEKQFLVFAIYPNGSAEKWMERRRYQGTSMSDLDVTLKIACQAASGVQYLHSKHVVHGDLAARNLLLDNDWNAAVADLGLACDLTRVPITPEKPFPLRWLAPEALKSRNQYKDCKTDVYMFAMLLYELFTGRHPFPDLSNEEVERRLLAKKDYIMQNFDPVPGDLQLLMKQCWQPEPDKRPTMDRVVEVLCRYRDDNKVLSVRNGVHFRGGGGPDVPPVDGGGAVPSSYNGLPKTGDYVQRTQPIVLQPDGNGEEFPIPEPKEEKHPAPCPAGVTQQWETKAHEGAAYCVCTLNNRRVATGGQDGKIKIWDLESRDCVRVLDEHTAHVHAICAFRDGTRIASGSRDGTVKIWDAESGACLRTLNHHTDPAMEEVREWVRAVAPCANDRLVSGDNTGMLKIWDLNTGECVQTQDLRLCIWSIAVRHDGSLLVGLENGNIQLRDTLDGGSFTRMFVGHVNHAYALQKLNRDFFASCSIDKTVRIWRVSTGQCLYALREHTNFVSCIALLPQGRLVSGSGDRSLKIWDLLSFQCSDTLTHHTGTVQGVSCTADGHIASVDRDGNLVVWLCPPRP